MSRITTPFVPSLQFEIQFARNNSPQTQNLAPFLIGSNAKLLRYDEPSEREAGLLGTYDPVGTLIEGSNQTAYAWPSLPTGGIIDDDYTRIHVKNAMLEYWNQAAGTMIFKGLNRIRQPTKNFITNGAFAAHADFGDREVQIGDRVLVKGLKNTNEEFSLFTYVQGFKGDLSASSVGAATAVSTNKAATTATASNVDGASNVSTVTATPSGTNYDGYASGFLEETYRIEVIQSSTGDDATTAKLKVTSGSGLDNQTSVTPAAFDAATTIGTRGLTVTFSQGVGSDELVLGDIYTITVRQAYALPVITVAGSYGATDYVDREYLVEVVTGAAAGNSPVIRISTTLGSDEAKSVTLVDGGAGVMNAVDLGSYGLTFQVTVDDGLVVGDKWTVLATASKPTNMRTLELAHSLPPGVAVDDAAAAALDVSLYLMSDIELPKRSLIAGEYNFSSHPAEVRIKAGINVEHPSWTVNDEVVALPLSVDAAMGTGVSKLYVTYRAWMPQSTGLISATDPGEVGTLLEGPNHPDNPLKYGMNKAMLTNEGRPVYFFNVGDPTLEAGWEAALRAADDTREVYGFVALTTDSSLLGLVAGHVTSRSGPAFNMYRVLWLTGTEQTRAAIIDSTLTSDDTPALATIADDPETSGTQYTLVSVTSDNVSFVELGVRAGDTLRYGYSTDLWGDATYSEYTIERVVNESTVVLSSGPSAAEAVAKRFEVHRVLSTEERVETFQQKVSPYSDESQYTGYRFRYLAFPIVEDGALEVPAYFMACTLAAMRSAYAPHQPMTRSAVPGFSGVKDVNKFSTEQLNEIAASGGFIVSPDIRSGRLVVRHAVTAGNWDNVNMREESVISNIDSNLFYFFQLLDPYVGKSNATDDTLASIAAELSAGKTYLQSANAAPGLGGQLVDMTVFDIRPSPLAKDTVLLDFEMLLAGPLNSLRVQTLIR